MKFNPCAELKDGYYIKSGCKNSKEEDMIDEDGFILDPLTYEKIPDGEIVKLSDGYCYKRSKELKQSILRTDRLPFGHKPTNRDILVAEKGPVTKYKKRKPILIIESDSPTDANAPEEVIEIIPRQRNPQTVRVRDIRERLNQTVRPQLVIESNSSSNTPSSESVSAESISSLPSLLTPSTLSSTRSSNQARGIRKHKRKTKKHKRKTKKSKSRQHTKRR